MVVQDFNLLFDMLDTDFKGYLTIEDVQLFDESTFFESLDLTQISAAIRTVYGDDNAKVTRGNFGSLLVELERRRKLEEKVSWDFKCLDMDKNGRISLQSALFLFKTVHDKRFSLKLWNSFLSSRCRPEDEVSFDEMRLFLCNIPTFDASGDQEYFQYHNQVRENQKEREYNLHQSLIAWQEDESTVVQKEKEKQGRTEKLKNSASYLLDRLDEIGLPALLEDDDGYFGRTEERPLERVNATDLLGAVKNKYDSVREHMLLQMLKIQVGEGMWAALSSKEQNERLLHLKVEEEKLRKDDKLELASRLPGGRHETGLSLLSLMDESLAEMEIREKKIKEKMKESGMEYEEIEEEFHKKLEFTEKKLLTTDQFLIALSQRLETERETLVNKLQGIGGFTVLNPGERETLFAMLLIMHVRAINELCFESAALAVGLTERLHRHSSETIDKDRKRQERLARKRLLLRKGRKVKQETALFKPVIVRSKKVDGRIDHQMNFVQRMEYRLTIEREVFINMLQGKDATQHRMSAKKLSRDGRANQSLVLKTQWQGWRDRSAEDKMASLEQHRALLQEAVALVFENRKEESRLLATNADDIAIASQMLSELQRQQELECKGLINFSDKDKSDIVRMIHREAKAHEEEWFDNIAAVIFNIKEVSNEEEEVIKALNEKYDALRDQLLLESLKKQMSEAEWVVLSEQERQARLTKLKLMERRLRKEGKYDEAAALLGDALKSSELLESLMGENKQRYQAKLQERLKNRKKRIQDGEDVDNDEEGDIIDEDEAKSTGNILRDLQLRYEEEKEALLRKLQEGEGKFESERERQAELMRLRLEKRKAEREGNFESAALVLGLAERNQASKDEKLRKDRERQEQLARERLEARRNARRKKNKMEEEPEPEKGNKLAWEESVMAELDRRHNQERDFFLDLMKDPDNEDIRDEAKEMSDDERQKRITQLKEKRAALDFEDSSDHEEHGAILEMAAAVKMVIRQRTLARKQDASEEIDDADIDEVIVSLMADLQQVQDKETKKMMLEIPEKTEEELVKMRTRQIDARKYEELSNVAEVIFSYEGAGTDKEIVKALDKKYDALMDKLILDSLKNQLGAAEWAAMSEKERQAELLRRRLEQKRLMREGKLEEAAKLLGEGFAADANLKKLMGQNRAKYDEMMKERLARRRERLRQGLPVDDDEGDEDLIAKFEEDEGEGKSDAKAILEDMQKRYEEEKEALMARLKGSDAQFFSEKQRQAELIRLKREQRMAEKEEKFGAAALVLGLAERNQANVESKLKADRARQEQLAKERLERMKAKRRAKKEKVELVTEGSEDVLRDALIRHIENRHNLEREELYQLLHYEDADLKARGSCMTSGVREERLKELAGKLLDSIKTVDSNSWTKVLKEMMIVKEVNRTVTLKSTNDVEPSKNDVVISIMADLQQQQDRETERQLKHMTEMKREELINEQKKEIDINENGKWPNIVITISSPEDNENPTSGQLVDAVASRYDALKEKLIYETLERTLGAENWDELSDDDKYDKMIELKQKIEKSRMEDKSDDHMKLMRELFPDGVQLDTMLTASMEEQEKRAKDREEMRESRRKAGMSEEEVLALEKEEDDEFEEELKKRSKRNVLLDLEHNVEAEKEALLKALSSSNAKLLSERERQIELARLKRDLRKARREQKFESAALILSLGKTQRAEFESKLKSDRKRQERLAELRLAERKARRDQERQAAGIQDDLEDINESSKLQDAVLSELDKKHTDERDLLLEILNSNTSSEWYKMASKLDIISKQRRLDELKSMRTHWREGSPDELSSTAEEQIDIFREAIALKLQLILAEVSGSESDHSKLEAASVAILADLQAHQDTEASYLMRDLSKKTVVTLKQLRKVQYLSRREKWYDNVAGALFGLKMQRGKEDETSSDELVDALDSKYSELKEKLFIEVLKKKYGEEEWNKMSHKEQQELIMKLRAEEVRILAGEEVKDSLLSDISITKVDSYVEQSREKKEEKLRKRMERKKRARELGISEEELARQEGEEIDDEEDEESIATSDMLKDLQSQYEAEKEALLAGLRGSEARLAKEKERQLALIKLRREKERIKREDKFDSAAILFHMAKEDQKNQEASYTAERARQEKLARDRIAALRAKKRAKAMTHSEKVLEELEKDIDNDVRLADQLEREGSIVYQNAVLDEMEKKHHSEQETLVELLSTVGSDKDAADAASYLSESQRREKLMQLRKDRDEWKDDAVRSADAMPPDAELTEEEKKSNAERLSSNWETNRQMLIDGLTLRVAGLQKDLLAKGYPPEKLSEEVSIIMLADLQEKQKSETNAMCTVISEKSSDILLIIKQEQRKARREFWQDNLATIILGAPVAQVGRKRSTSKPPDMSEISEDAEEMEEMLEEQEANELAALEKELESEKEKRRLQGLSEEEMMSVMAELQQQQEAKRKAVQASIEKQREANKRRLEERRRKRDEKQYEEDYALSIISSADRSFHMMQEKSSQQKAKQHDSLEDRLRQRKEQRKRKAEEEARKQREEEEQEKRKMEDEKEKAKKVLPPLPGGGLRREKTVVEQAADMDDSEKQEIVGVLMREQTNLAMRLNREQTRQEEMVKFLRSKRKQKQEQREQEAAKIIGLGERQKTIIATQTKNERERQIQSVKDRVKRIKYERTMTVKEPKEEGGTDGFRSLLEDDETEGLSEDEKMARAAKIMEMKFKQEVNQTVDQKMEDEDKDESFSATASYGGSRLDEKSQRQKLKDRYLQKKKLRKGKGGGSTEQDDAEADEVQD